MGRLYLGEMVRERVDWKIFEKERRSGKGNNWVLGN